MLKITEKDIGSIFEDGIYRKWHIKGFHPVKDYEVLAVSPVTVSGIFFSEDRSDYDHFNQFGKRERYKLDSEFSLKKKIS